MTELSRTSDHKYLFERLGFTEDSILLMIHADDAGLSHAENLATIHCLEQGSVNSCSVMVPCPWSFEMASYLKKNPNFDHGIHLTLTCEWHNYRFGPVLSVEEVPSLVDEFGYFFKDRQTLKERADPDQVRRELIAQIERGLKMGLRPSHLDSHMYSLGISQEFLEIYRDLGRRFELPVMLNETLVSEVSGLSAEVVFDDGDFLVPNIHLGRYDLFLQGELDNYYSKILSGLEPGFHMILIHPAFDDAEMRGVTWDHPNFGSEWRQIDTDFFSSDRCKDIIEERNIKMVNWNQIKPLLYP